MTTPDRALQDAMIKEAVRHACGLLARAGNRFESFARATGEHQFDSVLPELERLKQLIKNIAEGPPVFATSSQEDLAP